MFITASGLTVDGKAPNVADSIRCRDCGESSDLLMRFTDNQVCAACVRRLHRQATG